jgi:hypothetical protein
MRSDEVHPEKMVEHEPMVAGSEGESLGEVVLHEGSRDVLLEITDTLPSTCN